MAKLRALGYHYASFTKARRCIGASMKIILGKYMDGCAWPDAVTYFGGGLTAVDGVKICGPMGFLSLLHEKLACPTLPSMAANALPCGKAC